MKTAQVVVLLAISGAAAADHSVWESSASWTETGADSRISYTSDNDWFLALILAHSDDGEIYIITKIPFATPCSVRTQRFAVDRQIFDLEASAIECVNRRILDEADVSGGSDDFQIIKPRPENAEAFWEAFEGGHQFAAQVEVRDCPPDAGFWGSTRTFTWHLDGAEDALLHVRGLDEGIVWFTRTHNKGTAFEYMDAIAGIEEGPDETFLVLATRAGRPSLTIHEHVPPLCQSQKLRFLIDREMVDLVVDDTELYPPTEKAETFWNAFASGKHFTMQRIMQGCTKDESPDQYDETLTFTWSLKGSDDAIAWVTGQKSR